MIISLIIKVEVIMKTLHKNPITVMGKELDIGASAPDFTLIDNDLKNES